MSNLHNTKIVEKTTQKFKEADAIYFTDYKGLNVQLMNELRSEFFKNNIEYKVIKKTLTKIAGEEAGYKGFEHLMDGQMAVAFVKEYPVKPAKILRQFIKDNKLESLKMTGCIFEGSFFDATKVNSIADLPSRDELIAKFARTLNAPMTNVLNVLKTSMGNVLGVLNALKDKKEA